MMAQTYVRPDVRLRHHLFNVLHADPRALHLIPGFPYPVSNLNSKTVFGQERDRIIIH